MSPVSLLIFGGLLSVARPHLKLLSLLIFTSQEFNEYFKANFSLAILHINKWTFYGGWGVAVDGNATFKIAVIAHSYFREV